MYYVITSLFRYNELIISFIIRLTSAWKVNVSACSFNSRNWAPFNPSNFIRSSSFTAAYSSETVIKYICSYLQIKLCMKKTTCTKKFILSINNKLTFNNRSRTIKLQLLNYIFYQLLLLLC